MVGRSGYENVGLESGQLVDPHRIPNFLDISEQYTDSQTPLLDQESVRLKGLTEDQVHWRDFGYVIKKSFIPEDLVDQYGLIRRKLNLGDGPFADITPYLNHSTIRDICCSPELHRLMGDLLGEEMGLHFILADYVSTTRGWHQDDYLNPEDTYGRYAAIWMAMDDIDPDSGPFQFVPGSHKWPCLRNGLVKQLVIPEVRETGDHHWAVAAEYLVNKSVEKHIQETNSEVMTFEAKKGDILIWHGKLMHRGSLPKNLNLLRPAMIAHYSNIRNRRDFGNEITRHHNGGYYWEFTDLGRPLTGDVFTRIELQRELAEERGKSSGAQPTPTPQPAFWSNQIKRFFSSAA